MRYGAAARVLPRFLRRRVLRFEAAIEDAVTEFARSLPEDARVLDAGAGEGQYARWFARHRYCGVDLAIGDSSWNYAGLDVLADLTQLPFPAGVFAACVNVVTLEHVREPACVVSELHRALAPGGRLLLVVPQDWEVHQAPHDYFRYTRHGIDYLLRKAGFAAWEIRPVGGYFHLIARRLLNGLQFFSGGARWLLFAPAALLLGPPALILPALDFLDRERNFTLGYICVARKS
jgi:SAM-dependent methyltransferase